LENLRIPRITEEKTGTSQMKMDCYYGSLKEKIPAHVIIPRKCPIIPRKLKREDTGSYDNTAKFKKEDNGTYDNTSEVSENIMKA